MVNVICIKWGTLYSSSYVNNLYNSVKKQLSQAFRFVCFTDDADGIDPAVDVQPLPSITLPEKYAYTPWRKLSVLRNGVANLQGPTLFLDLDILITGPLDCFFDYHPGKFCIIHNWVQKTQFLKKKPDVGNSSVFRFEAGQSGFIYDQFILQMDWVLENFHPEQVYFTHAMDEKYYWPDAWVRSFKRHAVPPFPLNLLKAPQLPIDCKVLAFHGEPNPPEALKGFQSKKIHRTTKAAPWIAEFWGLS